MERMTDVFRRFHRPLANCRSGWPCAARPALAGRKRLWERDSAGATNPVADDSLPLGDHAQARSRRMARLEAVLLLAKEPLNSRKLAQLANLADGTEARTLARRLNGFYDADGRAFRIEEVAGGFQLLTRNQFAPWLSRLHSAQEEVRLSAPAMETLSVVAYRQPVMRAEVEGVRGVQCGELLRQLMERGLVRIVGRADELGRPFLYGTSKRFLQVFGLRHLDELPRADILRKAEETSETTQASGLAEQTAGEPAESEQESNTMLLVEPQTTSNHGEASEGEEQAINVLPADDARAPAAIFEEEPEDDDDDEDDDFDFDDDEDDDDEYDDDEEYEDDDLEDDEWEEVDDDDDEEEDDFDDEDDDDWDDDDEEDEWADDDWDDDDDDDEKEAGEDEL